MAKIFGNTDFFVMIDISGINKSRRRKRSLYQTITSRFCNWQQNQDLQSNSQTYSKFQSTLLRQIKLISQNISLLLKLYLSINLFLFIYSNCINWAVYRYNSTGVIIHCPFVKWQITPNIVDNKKLTKQQNC